MNLLVVTAVSVLFLDQLTKWLVVAGQPNDLPVLGKFFTLTYVINHGAAWGMFSQGMAVSNAVLAAFSIATVLALYGWRHMLVAGQWSQYLTLGMIMGGILGNLVDRVLRGHVVDFLYFYLGPSFGHWPAFNIADSAICVGVISYLFQNLRGHAAAAHAVIKSEGVRSNSTKAAAEK